MRVMQVTSYNAYKMYNQIQNDVSIEFNDIGNSTKFIIFAKNVLDILI